MKKYTLMIMGVVLLGLSIISPACSENDKSNNHEPVFLSKKEIGSIDKPLSDEGEAINILSKTIINDRLYPDVNKQECLRYFVEQISDEGYEIAIHENHNANCGGDPLTSPVRDRFKVLRKSGEVLWYDIVNGEYIAYSKAMLNRRSN